MRKFVYSLLTVLALATPIIAQELPYGDPRNQEFIQRFERIKALNDGEDFMKMRPGAMYLLPGGSADFLHDGDVYGIWGKEFEKTYGITYGESLAGVKPATSSTQSTGSVPTWPVTHTASTSTWPDSWIVFALLLMTAVVAMGFRYMFGFWPWQRSEHAQQVRADHELTLNPVTSGTPYVPGGIQRGQTAQLVRFYDELAVTAYVDRYPGTSRESVRPTRISAIEYGTITGEGLVGYLGGSAAPRRIVEPTPAYRARYRFPDQTEQELVTLQGCMNPVQYNGDVYTGFTFTPAANNVAVPEPEPRAPGPQSVPHPAVAIRAIRTAAETDGRSTVTIGDQMITFAHGAHFVVDKTTGTIEVSGQAATFTIKPKRVRKAQPLQVAKTGTNDKK